MIPDWNNCPLHPPVNLYIEPELYNPEDGIHRYVSWETIFTTKHCSDYGFIKRIASNINDRRWYINNN